MLKIIKHHWQWRRERFYKKNRWHLILDFSLALIVILLIAVLISLHYYNPKFSGGSVVPIGEKIELDLNNPPLVYNFSLAASSIRLEDGAKLKVTIKNKSTLSAENVKADLIVVDNNFSIDKIVNANKDDKTIISNRNIALGTLDANQEKTVELNINFNDKTAAVRTIKWQAQISYTIQGQNIKEVISLPELLLAAELSGSAMAYYNSPQGDQLGSGPLPPVIGLPTNYWIFFEVKSAGDFKNLVFSAKLPKGVELTDRRSLLAGDFKYNASARQIVWTVPELENQSDSYRLGFEVAFTPDATLLGKTATILTNIKYYAHDLLISSNSGDDLPNLSTNLDYDRMNKGQGVISQP